VNAINGPDVALGIILGIIICLIWSLAFGEKEPGPCLHSRKRHAQTGQLVCSDCGAVL